MDREDYFSEGMGAVLSRSGRVDPKSRRESAASSSRKDSRDSVSRRRSSGGQTPAEGRSGEQLRLPSTHSTGNHHGSPKEHKNHHGQKTSTISPQMVSSPAGRSPVAISNLQQARMNMITDGLTETYLVRCLLFCVHLCWPSRDVLVPFGLRHTRVCLLLVRLHILFVMLHFGECVSSVCATCVISVRNPRF